MLAMMKIIYIGHKNEQNKRFCVRFVHEKKLRNHVFTLCTGFLPFISVIFNFQPVRTSSDPVMPLSSSTSWSMTIDYAHHINSVKQLGHDHHTNSVKQLPEDFFKLNGASADVGFHHQVKKLLTNNFCF